MKKVLVLLTAVVLSTAAQAQSNQEVIDFYQSIFGMEKKMIVTQFIQLEGEAATSFWEIYDEYEVLRKEEGVKRFELLNKYVESYADITDDSANEMLKSALAMKKSNLKTLTKYSKKIGKSNGGKVAAQFYQIENYFNNTIALVITESIPFVGELD